MPDQDYYRGPPPWRERQRRQGGQVLDPEVVAGWVQLCRTIVRETTGPQEILRRADYEVDGDLVTPAT